MICYRCKKDYETFLTIKMSEALHPYFDEEAHKLERLNLCELCSLEMNEEINFKPFKQLVMQAELLEITVKKLLCCVEKEEKEFIHNLLNDHLRLCKNLKVKYTD